MQKAIRGRTTMMTQRHMPEIPGNNIEEPELQKAPDGLNYCPLSDPKEEKRREADALLQEYNKLRVRLGEVQRRLHQLGFHVH